MCTSATATAPAERYVGINLGDLRRPGARLDRADKLAFIGLNADLNEHRFTFADLDQLTDSVARDLQARGLVRGDRVAIVGVNSVEYVAVFLATMRAGLVAVPINFKFPAAMIEFVLNDSGARLVYCDGPRQAVIPPAFATILLETVTSDLQHEAPFTSIVPTTDETAMLLYTSGSTGTPKGVRLSHFSHVWTVQTRLAADPLANDRILIAAPLYHMNALALTLLTLAARATTVLLPQFTAANYIAAISRYRCTWLTAVPPMIAMMLRETALLAQADLRSVRVIRMGSAPVSERLLQRTRQLLPNARVINAYGTTEGGPIVFGPHPGHLPTPPMAVGVPHPQVQLRLVAADGHPDSDAVEDIRTGVLQMRSPGLMSGYHNRPTLKTPFTPDGYYITGDVFARDDAGFYSFVGRHDDMFVSGGENIYPGEVEKMLERHPAVQQAAVVPIDDEIKGTKPVAFIVPVTVGNTEGTSNSDAQRVHPDPEDIKRFALDNAPAYQHPRHIWFLDAMPLASTNKIDRRALLEEAQRRMAAE